VVDEVIGPDIPAISATSPTAAGVTHRWTDMQSFVTEVSEARIWAGFHYRFSTRAGMEMGYRIGAYVAKNSLQPLPVATR
jgi:mono/diheme cytochrome c family protein